MIQSLDEHRKNLKDGEECPLCGALEHPFAKGNVPQIGEKEKELAELRKQFQDFTKAVQENEKKLSALDSDNRNALKNIEKEKKYLSENSLKQAEILSEIKSLNSSFSIPKEEQRIEILEDILSNTKLDFDKINDQIERATKIEKQVANLRDKEIPALQNEKEVLTEAKSKAEIEQKLAEQNFNNKKDLFAEAQDKYKIESNNFSEKLIKYGVENIEGLNCLDVRKDNKEQIEGLISKFQT